MVDGATFLEEIKQQRDAVRVQIHLGSMEAKSHWEALEAKWKEVLERPWWRETSTHLQDAGRNLAEELKKGYAQLSTAIANRRANEDDEPCPQDVERLAYLLWERRGRPLGSPDEDWLEARRIIKQQQRG